MPLADVAEAVWYGSGAAARVARAVLSPVSAVFGTIVSSRNARYDAAPAAAGPIPAISVGNLSVGGTGKTPVSAWLAARFRELGATPAMVLRGYGDDEPSVHRLLNPGIAVVVGADRSAAVLEAAAGGADVAVLDDAFQHRRAARVADLVLISADRWTGTVRLLPAGPFREPMSALRRATLVAITNKAAGGERIRQVESAVRAATAAPIVTVDLLPASCVSMATGATEPVGTWAGRRVLAVSGIGDPAAFETQLKRSGLLPTALSFADHHSYDSASLTRILAAADGFEAVLCTLKDAVKLGARWPSGAVPLWYVSQSVIPRDGAGSLDELVRSVLQARRSHHSPSDLSR